MLNLSAATTIDELATLAAGGTLRLETAGGVEVASLANVAISAAGVVTTTEDPSADGGTIGAAQLLAAGGTPLASFTAGLTGTEDLALQDPTVAEGDAVSATLTIRLVDDAWLAAGAVRPGARSESQLYRVTGIKRIPGAAYKTLALEPVRRPLNR